MFNQTIALFRFQLLGLINRRTLVMLATIVLTAFMASRFIAELSIINSETIALGALADILRYSLVIVLIISVCFHISQDYELNQFERLLAMPISRYQYLLAQTMVLTVFCLLLVLPVFILMSLVNEVDLAIYWTFALFLELMLVGHFALLSSLSLEKLPLAVLLTIALYLLAKSAPVIEIILAHSSPYYDGEAGFRISTWVFSVIQYVLPDMKVFAQNNLLFSHEPFGMALGFQFLNVVIYSLLLQAVMLVDFYRKEFNN